MYSANIYYFGSWSSNHMFYTTDTSYSITDLLETVRRLCYLLECDGYTIHSVDIKGGVE